MTSLCSTKFCGSPCKQGLRGATGPTGPSTPGSSPPPGSVQFASTIPGQFSSDGSNFFWDDTNNRLGIGNNTPTNAIDTTNGFIKTAGLAGTTDVNASIVAGPAVGAGNVILLDNLSPRNALSGQIIFFATVSSSGVGTIATIIFSGTPNTSPFIYGPRVFIAPANDNSGNLTTISNVYAVATAVNAWELRTPTPIPPSPTSYLWNYFATY